MEELAKTAFSLVAEVKQNFTELLEEWRTLQQELLSHTPPPPSSSSSSSSLSSPPECQLVPHLPTAMENGVSASTNGEDTSLGHETLLVRRSDLEKLSTEAMMLKEFLPKVLNHQYVAMVGKLSSVEQELEAAVREKDVATSECDQLRRRTEALMSDCEQEKRERFETKNLLTELNEQLSQQADYCSSLGASSCTLLWRVSQREDCVHSILSGSKVDDFLQLVSSTVQSFQVTYSDGVPQESSEEVQFVLALCGIITNIGASSFGRDYLSSNATGHTLIDVFCSILADTPISPQWAKLKNLILMSLYNISINQKGLQYLTSKPDLMSTLVWILQEETDTDNRLHAVKLLQSLLLEPVSPAVVQHALQVIPTPLLQSLCQDTNTQVQDIATELMSDLNSLAAQLQTHSSSTLSNGVQL